MFAFYVCNALLNLITTLVMCAFFFVFDCYVSDASFFVLCLNFTLVMRAFFVIVLIVTLVMSAFFVLCLIVTLVKAAFLVLCLCFTGDGLVI